MRPDGVQGGWEAAGSPGNSRSLAGLRPQSRLDGVPAHLHSDLVDQEVLITVGAWR